MYSGQSLRYCVSCGTENARSADLCRRCGRRLAVGAAERVQGAAFVLNELEAWRDEQVIENSLYLRLRERYLPFLRPREEQQQAAAPARSAPAYRSPVAQPPKPPISSDVTEWLAEQQANLLLYLGAFLVVIAALVYIGFSGQASNVGIVKLVLLPAYTLAFLAVGLACLRVPRVRQAGLVFVAVGALMVPINFVGAYAYFSSNDNINPTALWLTGSIVSALFYAAISYAGLGNWYAVPMVGAAFSSLTAALVLTNAPAEAYPGSYIALSGALSLPALLPEGRVRNLFGPLGSITGNVVVPIALVVALGMTVGAHDHDSEFFNLHTRWYLPPAFIVGALFYWLQAAARRGKRFEEPLAIAALAVSGAAGVTFAFAIDAGEQWYGPAVALLGLAYAAAGVATTGFAWKGRRHLSWMSLGAVTLGWLLFEGLYKDFPRHGAGVHLGAAAFYLAAARLIDIKLPVWRVGDTVERKGVRFDLPIAVPLFYLAALTFGIGMYEIVSATEHVAAAPARDAIWTFFALSLVSGAIAATMRWWWGELRLHAYGVALAMSLFVLLASSRNEGQVTLLLGVYAAVALALTLWESQPLGLAIAAAYGAGVLLAAWRYYEPDDAYLPLVLSATAASLFATSALLPVVARRLRSSAPDVLWAKTLQALAFVFAAAAPIAGAVRLSMLVNSRGLIDGAHYYDTLLFQLTVVSIGLFAVAGATTRWWWRELRPYVSGAALIMSIIAAQATIDAEGQVTVLLAGFGLLALALVIYEREPFALAVPAGFGYAALIAAWRLYTPNDALLPLAVSAIGVALFAASVATRRNERMRPWSDTLLVLGLAYALAAPVTGWMRLRILADGSQKSFETAALYQTSAAAVGVLAVLAGIESALRRRIELAYVASALAMVAALLEVGHFRPENAQAYTAPLGVYVLTVALLTLRVRNLRDDIRSLIPAVEVLGAALIMGPSFVQSLHSEAWRYGLMLLGESIGMVVLALVQRRIWLIAGATTFAVMDGAHYLFFAGGPVIPNWAILASAGTAVMAAGTSILLGRDRWTVWQRTVQSWWYREQQNGAA